VVETEIREEGMEEKGSWGWVVIIGQSDDRTPRREINLVTCFHLTM
jgi:hypothetical protein